MRCSSNDTGPNGVPCQNEATTRNIIGQPCCKSCADFSNKTIIGLNDLASKIGMPIPFPLNNN